MKAPQPLSGLTEKDGPNLESAGSGIHWGAIFGGAVAAAAVSLILIPLGSAFGFSTSSVFNSNNPAAAFTVGWAIWLVVMQWVSSFFGGYIAGRLRVRWADLHSDEVFFRDTAHGFLAWAVATLFTFSLVAVAGSAVPVPHEALNSAAANPDDAHKAAVGFSTVLFVSLLVGAFIASVSAALGGRLRDQY